MASDHAVISIPEAARLLGIPVSTAYDVARKGDIPTIRIGRRIRVPIAELQRKLGTDEQPTHVLDPVGFAREVRIAMLEMQRAAIDAELSVLRQ